MRTQSKIFILSQKDMTSTLSKYVDKENIPKKYGGTLDWKFGDMPNLEPAIANSLTWKEQIELDGHRTLPIGPIKLEYDEKGDLVVIAIGSENGKPRNRIIAGLRREAGVALLALSPGRVDNSQTDRTTTAHIPTSASNPPAPAKINMSSDADLNVGKDPQAHVPDSSRAGTYTVPYRESGNGVVSSPVDAKQGTSTTRYEQQQQTHAEGQLADGTPDVKVDSQGEKQAVMEPNTVGQAPKEHPVPNSEEPQPSVVDQAKGMAEQAMEQAKAIPTTVMSAVGMGGKDGEELPKEMENKQDLDIDQMGEKNVEEFLRTKTMSKTSA